MKPFITTNKCVTHPIAAGPIIMPPVLSKALKDQIKSLLNLIQGQNNLVSGVTKLLEVLEANNFVYKVRLHPSLVVVHAENRDGYGVGAHDVHQLADDLADIGFDETQCDPVCVEIRQVDIDFNTTLVAEADGLLGDVSAVLTARFASLGSSHCNYVLRLVNQGVKHDGKQILCQDGEFSLARTQEKRETMHKACTLGLNWRVVRQEIVDEFPEIPSVIQMSGNTRPDRGEHELQNLRRAHNLYNSESKRLNRPCKYTDIKDALLRSKPKCAAALSCT